ncbi:hypothetical protein DCAR_0103819 [Daucus carota subsp. sativus]|uniref:ABC-type xenobiotic transporter n=1 Tax=Daucus carota subsp. sativus TaxID=79200 RepID=A0A166IB85_DAUCS|nr:hypothetical protein DCAR_0103819 [Daucus carota subsp. sativus]
MNFFAEGSLNNVNQDVPNLQKPLLDHGNSKDEAGGGGCHTVTSYENAGLFQTVFFSWITPLLALATTKTTLDLDDIPQLGPSNSVFGAFPFFRTTLLESSSQNNNYADVGGFSSKNRVVTTELGLAKAYILLAWKEIIWTALQAIIYTLARYVSPYLIDSFVHCLYGREVFNNQGYILALTFCAATFLEGFIRKHWIFKMQQIGIRLRGVTTVMLYNKSLTLPSWSSQLQGEEASRGSGGELINAVAVDVQRIQGFIVYMHDTWLIFFQIGLALLVLYKKLGLLASVGAFVVTLIFMESHLKWGKCCPHLLHFGLPIFLLPDTLYWLVQAKVSLGRIASFLSLDELQDNGLEKLPLGSSDKAVEIINGNFTWDNSLSTTTATLKDINLKVSRGMKVRICGTVGSGKSSLLCCILGEMPRISGDVKFCGTKAYVAQSPWIHSGTVQENILFGKDMDQHRYDQVLEACCLEKDIEILSFGDQTLIGEKGINLSKEYKLLAHSIMMRISMYLMILLVLWMPILEVLLGLQTVVYVTHQVEFLNVADLIVNDVTELSGQGTVQVGKYDEILVPGSDFIQLVGAQNAALSSTLESNRAVSNSADNAKSIIDSLVTATGYKTATILFKNMLESIFCAPMSFFNATPAGRILNRFSTDQSVAETRIPSLLASLISCTIQLVGIIAVISTVAWEVLVIFIPLIFASIWYQQYYMPASRELSRLCRVCEAPVIQYFNETISGIATIRSFDQESRFQPTFMEIVDSYSRPEFQVAAAMKWLLLRLDAFSCITLAFLLFISIYFRKSIDPAIAGLVVTYGLTLNGSLSGVIWCLCHWETKMISVERIIQYMTIPSEAPLIIQENRPDNSWPSRGEIDIHNLHVQYAPHLPLILHGVTCTFPAGMKTGIVGRTGSGKTTLVQALFRVVEPRTGSIVIDGVDISSIGLQDLRSRLSIIPQDPIMFQGTLRSNLDPLDQYTDAQIWDTLDKCQLGDQVRKMERKLDSNVHENGENWSLGQRQLVCLGRVLLKKSKVVIFDEATASVDTNTDNLLQRTLKDYFSDCTLITIAHRVTSVLDSDMVVLLSHGLVKEYDSPSRLLQNRSSSFSKLVAEYTSRSSNSNAR